MNSLTLNAMSPYLFVEGLCVDGLLAELIIWKWEFTLFFEIMMGLIFLIFCGSDDWMSFYLYFLPFHFLGFILNN